MKFSIKYIIVLIVALLATQASYAQKGNHDKVEALKVSFITDKLKLSTQEAQSFWPLYNEYNDKIKFARKNFRQQYNNINDFKTDKEAETYLAAELNLKQKEYEVYRDYYEKFKKILPVKKVAAVKRAEEDFKKELIKIVQGNN